MMERLIHRKIITTIIIICTALCMLTLQAFISHQPPGGETLFKKHCQRCHGADGTRGLFGAKNLTKSNLSDEAIGLQINNGNGVMPGFKKKLAAEEISQLVSYVKSLRKN
jgi:cytochrome c6